MEYIYYDDHPSSSDDEVQLTGGIRQSPFLQYGNNANSTPYHVAETMGIASAGKMVIPKSIKTIGKTVGKEVYKEVKPIVVQQGRQMLKEGINSLLNSQQSITEGSGRKRGRPKKMIEDGGKIHLGKVLKAIGKSPITKQIQDELIQQGVQQGIAYASGAGMYPATMDSGTMGGKFKIGKTIGKIAKSHIVKQIGQEALHQGIQMGVEGLMAGAGKSRSGRGAIVKRIMVEKGLSLPMASKYVKEHNLY